MLDADSIAELRAQAQRFLRESVEQTVARLSTPRRKNFRHSEAGLRRAVADAHRLLTDPDAATERLLGSLASIEAEAQLLALPTDVEDVAEDLQRLRALVVQLQAEVDRGARNEATVVEATAICEDLAELRVRPAMSQELRKLAAEFSMLSARLERLGVSAASEQSRPSARVAHGREGWGGSIITADRQTRASTFANVPSRREVSPSSPKTPTTPNTGDGIGCGRTWVGETDGKPSVPCLGLHTAGQHVEGNNERQTDASRLMRSSSSSAPEPGRAAATSHAAVDHARADAGPPRGSVGVASPAPWTAGRSVGTQLKDIIGSNFTPASTPSDAEPQSFRLQEWDDSIDTESFGKRQASQLQRLSADAATLAEAHREMAHLIEAASPDIKVIEQQVDETVRNTGESVDHLASASRARGWTLKASCPSAVIGMGVGFVVGGPLGAAVVGSAGAAVGAMAGKAAKWRHNRKIDKVLADQSQLKDRRRSSIRSGR